MKSTNQVPRKRGIKPASTQVKRTPDLQPVPGIPEATIDECAALMLFKDGVSVGHIFLTDEQFTQINARCHGNNNQLVDMLKQSLDRMLVKDNGSPSPAPDPYPLKLSNELEAAKTQCEALAFLFVEAICRHEDGTPADHIQSGLIELYAETHGRLDRAVEAVLSKLEAQGQPKEVAA
jgi:hypothetical protein